MQINHFAIAYVLDWRGVVAFVLVSALILASFPQETLAADTVVFLTSGTSWTVPSDFGSCNTIEAIGGGGSGGVSRQSSTRYGTGGGGGGYAKAKNISLTPGASVSYAVGAGGAAVARTSAGNSAGNSGGDTYLCNSSSNCASISGTAVMAGAKGGSGGEAASSGSASGGAGGAAASAVGGVGGGFSNPGTPYAYAGGAGGNAVNPGVAAISTGAGGAGGPNGAGNAGVTYNPGDPWYGSDGGSGDAGSGGSAGTGATGGTSSGSGGAGAEWDATHGSGGGGGGLRTSDGSTGTAGSGGNYGGGGGGVSGTAGTQTSGAGTAGLIVITYTPNSSCRGKITFTGGIKIEGNFAITGSLSKGSGTFVIDHPLAPLTKLLYHSFVESPDAKNVYDGVATLDERGEAIIRLPDYFEALNNNFRYQFFPHFQAMPDLYVKKEVENNQFTIAGGKPGGEITWQISGIRHDPYILANPVVDEVWKSGETEVGRGECLFEPLCE